MAEGLLQGVSICQGALVISHLLFADDNLLFGKATMEECMVIKSVLEDYEAALGQHVNFTKSNIVFSKVVLEALRQSIVDVLTVSIVEKHDKYLVGPVLKY